MLCYNQLWTVEQTFRLAKPMFSTRPIFHKLDETSVVACSAVSSRWYGAGGGHCRPRSLRFLAGDYRSQGLLCRRGGSVSIVIPADSHEIIH
jgi:hypothetical protein